MDLFLAVLLFNALLALLYAAGELVVPRRGPRNWLLFAIFFALALMMLHAHLMISGAMLRFPHLLGWHFPLFLALGPLLDRYIQLRLDLPGGRRWWLHLVPALLAVGLLLYFLNEPAETKRALIAGLQKRRLTAAGGGFLWLTNLHFLVYILRAGWRLTAALRLRLFRREPAVRILFYVLGLAGATSLLVIIAFLSGDPRLIAGSLALLGLLLPSLYLIRQRVPDFFEDLELVVRKEKYANSQLKNTDLETLAGRLERLMDEEALYRDEALSLPQLAERLGLTSHKLSEYFNNHLKINFAGYVNRRRVREACRLLLEEPELTVLAAAYRVGFNSKSSFNTAFARETGLSPTAYRRKHAG